MAAKLKSSFLANSYLCITSWSKICIEGFAELMEEIGVFPTKMKATKGTKTEIYKHATAYRYRVAIARLPYVNGIPVYLSCSPYKKMFQKPLAAGT